MFNFFSKKERWLPILALIIVGSFIYSFNLNNGLFWDDDDWIINNNFVHSMSWNNVKFWFSNDVLAGVGLQSNYYRPFLFFTFALNWVVSETQPFFWHFVSNSIHIANAVLVFILLRKALTTPHSEVQPQKSSRLNLGTLTAFLTALFFVIHPLNTEAVTYISGRGDPLSAFLMLLALYLWINDLRSRLSTGWRYFRVLSLLTLVLALLSRETGVIFPFLLMVFYIAFVSNQGSTFLGSQGRTFLSSIKNALKEALPYFGVVVVYGILRLTVLNFQNTLNFYAAPNLYSENIFYRLFTFMHVLVDYFRLLFAATGLHMERSATVHTSLFQWPVWLGAAIVFSILYIVYGFYQNEKKSLHTIYHIPHTIYHIPHTTYHIPHTNFRVWFFGWTWFFIGLSMVSGITPINALIYEHWLYLPMVGFWTIISFYLVKLLNYQGSTFLKIQGRTFVIVALVAYLSFFSYQSIQRNILWGDPIEFYKDILKYEPDSVRINNNLGNLYFDRNDKEQAEFYYRKAVESNGNFAQPHFNIGSILQSRGDIDGAIAEFDKAIEIDPDFYYPYQNLAVIYAQQGDLVKAVINIEKLKLLIPNNPRVYYNSALVYVALNNREKAIADLNEGLKYSSADPETGRLIEELIVELEK